MPQPTGVNPWAFLVTHDVQGGRVSMPRRGLEPPREITPTSTSSWRVCQFRHLGSFGVVATSRQV